jgi:hypothetical protein
MGFFCGLRIVTGIYMTVARRLLPGVSCVAFIGGGQWTTQTRAIIQQKDQRRRAAGDSRWWRQRQREQCGLCEARAGCIFSCRRHGIKAEYERTGLQPSVVTCELDMSSQEHFPGGETGK